MQVRWPMVAGPARKRHRPGGFPAAAHWKASFSAVFFERKRRLNPCPAVPLPKNRFAWLVYTIVSPRNVRCAR